MDNNINLIRETQNKINSWQIILDGDYTTSISNYLIDEKGGNIPEGNVFAMVENMAQVLSYCPNPKVKTQNQNTGIVIGKVQSGKTSNFITLSALAFDNGYNISVVFGGTKKNLLHQNTERIKEYYNDKDNVKILDTNINKEIINENEIQKFLKNNSKIIIVGLKHKKHIDMITKVFSNTILGEREPVLIIDDEGDEASLNTKYKKRGASTIYKEIIKLKESIQRNSFITVTATPQANILIDSFSNYEDSRLTLSPDFGVLCKPGNGYCGLNTFHQEDSKFTVQINENEELLTDETVGICESYKNCLFDFFISCGLYRYRGMKKNDKLSMLVNPSPNIHV